MEVIEIFNEKRMFPPNSIKMGVFSYDKHNSTKKLRR